MDNSQITLPSTQVPPPVSPVATPVVPISEQSLTEVPSQLTPPPPPQYPVSGGLKEHAPIVHGPVQEYLRPTEVQPQLSPEVQEAGVEVVENKEQPQLDQSHQAVGIEHAKESTPVNVAHTNTVYLPYNPAQVKEIEKKVPVTESKHWLAMLTDYIVQKIQGVTQ